MRSRWVPALVGVLVVALVVAAVVALSRPAQKRVAAIFPQVVALYPDDEVRVLGVKVGTITGVTQVPGGVRVDMVYDADAPVPADARAAIVAPSLLNRRYVQLAPAKVAGPRLPEDAVIGLDRTAVPVEYDEIKKQLEALATTLGPTDPTVNGALGRALTTTAANLRGNGGELHGTLENLSRALGTLSDGREDLFGTVRHLQTLVGALRAADSDVDGFTRELAETSDVLNSSGDDLSKALDTLDSSVKRIGDFVADNRDRVDDNVKKLRHVADTLADNRQALANVLQIAPAALSDFQNIYDSYSGSITGALAATNFSQVQLVNGLLGTLLGPIPGGLIGQRNGSTNYITQNDGRCKPPKDDPTVDPPFNPLLTPPPPYGGTGRVPYFAERNRCHGPGGGASMFSMLASYDAQQPPLVNLLLPGGK